MEIVGTDGEFTTGEIEFQVRNIIVTHFTQILASSGIPVLDMAANTLELGRIVHERIAPMIAAYGLELPAFMIENVSLPADVEAALDKRTSTGIAGDLRRYTDFSAAEAMTRAAGNPGGDGGIGAGLGMGMGVAMAERMRAGPWGQTPASPETPPPPPAPDARWHVAEGGATRGPFSRAELAAMASAGSLTAESYVWTPGAPGWAHAGEVAELAPLFGQVPPPPPAA
jgi:hypothetical protein